MLKIFSKETTSFFNNGIGVLTDYTSDPIITEVLNGEYILELEYLKNGKYADYLVQENIIKANSQLFRISSVDKNLKTIKVLAKHIAFDLSKNFLVDVAPTNKTCQDALTWILENTQATHSFTAYSDIPTIASARYVRKNVMEAITSADNSILKVWGGELEFDNYNIKLLQKRGSNRGLSIRYGKNLTGVEYKLDFSSVATKIMPQGKNELLLPEEFIESPLISSYAFPIFKKIELDIGVDDETTEDRAYQLMRYAVQKMFDNGLDKPTISVKVDFLELSKIQEYSNYSNLEAAYLGDTIQFIISDLNLNFETRIVKTEYNCVKQKFEKLELGSVVPDFINQNSKQISELKETIDRINPTNILVDAQKKATELITNAMGGYIYKTNTELYIMDTDNLNTAQKVWRWNINGLGYSSTGVAGPYGIAMTSNGQIVANFITTGELDGQLIKAGSIKAPQIDTNTLKFGGNNAVRNSARYFDTDWDNIFDGYEDTEISNNTVSKKAFFVGDTTSNGTMIQTIQIQNGTYTISWKYKKLLELANVSMKINDNEIILDSLEWKSDSYTFEVLSNTIKIEVISDTNNSCYLSDLMGNAGLISQIWSSAPGESINGGVRIGSSIEVTSSTSNIMQKMDNDGNRIINTNTGETVSEFTDKGIDTQEIKADKGQVANILILDMGTQTWFSRM